MPMTIKGYLIRIGLVQNPFLQLSMRFSPLIDSTYIYQNIRGRARHSWKSLDAHLRVFLIAAATVKKSPPGRQFNAVIGQSLSARAAASFLPVGSLLRPNFPAWHSDLKPPLSGKKCITRCSAITKMRQRRRVWRVPSSPDQEPTATPAITTTGRPDQCSSLLPWKGNDQYASSHIMRSPPDFE